MRNFLNIIGVVLIGVSNKISATSFAKTYGAANEDFCYSVKQTNDGGYIIAGRTNSFGAGNYDFLIVKTQDGQMAPDCPWYEATNL